MLNKFHATSSLTGIILLKDYQLDIYMDGKPQVQLGSGSRKVNLKFE